MMQPAPTEQQLVPEPPAAADGTRVDAPVATCPVAHHRAASAAATSASAGGCPVAHGTGVRRSPADHVVRKVLRIRDRPAGAANSAYGSFQRSMLISAVRCTLTYVVFPFVAPAVGFATGVGPVVGILIGSFAMVCDVFTIRRFFAVDHKWRWPISAVAFCVICLLAVLLVQDVSHLLR